MAIMMAFGMTNASASNERGHNANNAGFTINFGDGRTQQKNDKNHGNTNHNQGHNKGHQNGHQAGHGHDKGHQHAKNHFICKRHHWGAVRGCRDCARMIKEARFHRCHCCH